MARALLILVIVLVSVSLSGVRGEGLRAVRAGEEPAVTAQAPALADQLRYIGRDGLTGMPVTVNDRFIADVERAVERYGIDESKPQPPPPAGEDDVVAVAIPALGVAAPVGRYGLDRFGRLDVPQDTRTVGWNPAFAALPGTGRSTFFAAHFEYRGVAGVFNRLATLRTGDELRITLASGAVGRYRVTSTIDYALGAIDMGALLTGREGIESVILMTCSGPASEGNYPLRTVVLAEAIRD